MKNYYEALGDDDSGFRAHIESSDGKILWHSPKVYDTEAEALDAAVEWAEDHNVDVVLCGAE